MSEDLKKTAEEAAKEGGDVDNQFASLRNDVENAAAEMATLSRRLRQAAERYRERQMPQPQHHAELMSALKTVADKTDAAYHEANSVNVKIANLDKRLVQQGDVLVQQGDDAAADRNKN